MILTDADTDRRILVHSEPPLNRSTQIPLSEGFGQLKSLTSLNLSGDIDNPMALKFLPEGAHSLIHSPSPYLVTTSLEPHMNHLASTATLPEGFGELGSLHTLSLRCYELEALPASTPHHCSRLLLTLISLYLSYTIHHI